MKGKADEASVGGLRPPTKVKRHTALAMRSEASSRLVIYSTSRMPGLLPPSTERG